MSIRQRCVVWVPREPDDPQGRLPAAEPVEALGGGPRSLHEIAVALAAAGHAVELRGSVHLGELAALTAAAGVEVEVPGEPRAIEPGDVVIAPEGVTDPLSWARLILSPARVILLFLAPPGLFGWGFDDGSTLPSAHTVALDAVGRPSQLRAAAALGLELWTPMPRLAADAEAAGVPCALLGNGRPLPYPEPAPKAFDVATFGHNRWRDDARTVVERLGPGVSHREIAGPNSAILEQLGQARILVHPMRIEGHSRIGQEARAMGAVVVTLDSNRYAVGLDDAGGAVAVASVDEMPAAVEALLADPGRLSALRERAMRSAREQVDWSTYVRRVDAALARDDDDPARAARGQIGDRIRDADEAARERERRHSVGGGRARAPRDGRVTAP